jgi:hypothetical protein
MAQSTIEQFSRLYLTNIPQEGEYDVKNIASNCNEPVPSTETYRRYLDISAYKNRDKSHDVFKPIILYAENKINYSLPYGFEEFYKLLSKEVDFINGRAQFHHVLDIDTTMIALPDEEFIDPFSHTCDEWLKIITESETWCFNYVFINCNRDSEHFGRLIFLHYGCTISEDVGYVSGFYFEEFLIYMIEEYDKLKDFNMSNQMCLNSEDFPYHIQTIVRHFIYDFDANKYFSERNGKIEPWLKTYFAAGVSDLILTYLQYNDIYPKHLV